MNHIISLSGGVGSAVAADRVINKYGAENVLLWFADTNWEHPDLYRFLDDLGRRWNATIIKYKDGRTPLKVAEDRKIIPSNRIAPCTFELKIKPFENFIKLADKPATIYLGLDWSEVHRQAAPKKNYEQIAGVKVEYPLMWKPYDYSVFQTVRGWGIEIPELYKQGFKHNNCGGRCVKQGQGDWLRLLSHYPAEYLKVEGWEQDQRDKGGARANYSITKDQGGGTITALTLAELRQRKADKQLKDVGDMEDLFSCFCSY